MNSPPHMKDFYSLRLIPCKIRSKGGLEFTTWKRARPKGVVMTPQELNDIEADLKKYESKFPNDYGAAKAYELIAALRPLLGPQPIRASGPVIKRMSQLTKFEWMRYEWHDRTSMGCEEHQFQRGFERTPASALQAEAEWDAYERARAIGMAQDF